MATVKTIVCLGKKEIDDAIIEVARKHLGKAIGGAAVEFNSEAGKIESASVTFSGKVQT